MREYKFRVRIFQYVRTNTFIWNLNQISEWKALTGVEVLSIDQFTGRKDKNGKEIYSGDEFGIYKLSGDFEGTFEPWGKVYFDDDLASFCVELPNGGWEYLSDYLDKEKHSEIFRNIYENPELLTKGE